MGVSTRLRRILGRGERAAAPRESPTGPHSRSVDTALIIEAARLVVTTRTASATLFERQLSVTAAVARQLLHRLEHCEVVAPEEAGRPRRVLTTSAQLPGVIEEFRRRDGS